MNTENLDQIQAARAAVAASIRKHGPEHFDMEWWFHGDSPSDLFAVGTVDITACGTTACVAGHVMLAFPELANAGFKSWYGIERHKETITLVAGKIGLDDGDGDRPGSSLFYADTCWPDWMTDTADTWEVGMDLVDWGDFLNSHYVAQWMVVLSVMDWLVKHPEQSAIPRYQPEDLTWVEMPDPNTVSSGVKKVK